MRNSRFVEERISIKYGAGGGAMRALIEQVFAVGFGAVPGGIGLPEMDDGAAIPIGGGRWLVVTTDAHVVSPLVFPGGDIMAGIASPHDCALFGKACTPDAPVGACMVSSEGTCKIWHQYGGRPELRQLGRRAS